MPSVQFGLSSYQRGRGDLPELPVINAYAEEAPTEETGVVLQSRPGIEDRGADMGSGPVRQLFQRSGVLDDSLFGVSGSSLYRGETLLGTIDGDGPVSMAGNEMGLMVAAVGDVGYYNGTALATVTFPDGAAVRKVFQGGSRFWFIRDGTGKVYFTGALGVTVTGLNFVTAESAPDELLDGLWIDDGAVLFGAETVEFWPNTQDDDLPIQPLEGRVIEKGIRATGCAAAFGPTFAWVTNENQVCIENEQGVISNPGLQARIEASGSVRLFTFLLDGNECLALRLDTETHVYHSRSGAWSEFQSYGEDNWVPQCWAGNVFGSGVDGKTLRWSEGHEDLGGQLERRFRGGFPINSGGVSINSVRMRCNMGQTPFLTGDYTAPVVEMRLSRDAGQTWGPWKASALGAQGHYRTQPHWRALGMASQPAFLAEWRVTAPVDWRVSDVLVNEPLGGR